MRAMGLLSGSTCRPPPVHRAHRVGSAQNGPGRLPPLGRSHGAHMGKTLRWLETGRAFPPPDSAQMRAEVQLKCYKGNWVTHG